MDIAGWVVRVIRVSRHQMLEYIYNIVWKAPSSNKETCYDVSKLSNIDVV